MNVVTCKCCGKEHNVKKVKFLDVEESIEGWDILTFRCPITGDTNKSVVRRK